MDIVRLAGAGLAAVVICGAAWGQTPKPTYEDALTAVTEGGCKRTEAERYIRYYCEQSEALFYFTHEGRPEHTGYFIGPAYGFERNLSPMVGGYDGRGVASREAALERIKVYHEWTREMIAVWQEDARRMKGDSGLRLYPLEPQ